jgi:predicted NBD/HSP70 family sugar kinase
MDATRKLAARAGEQLASLIATMDPEVLFLHGPVTEMPLLVDLVRQEIPARIGASSNVSVELSSLGQDGPVLGVTLLALAIATAKLVGASAAPPRYLYTEMEPRKHSNE